MTAHPDRHVKAAHARSAHAVAAMIVGALLVAACAATSAPSAATQPSIATQPSATPAPSSEVSQAPATSPAASAPGPVVGQTDTDFGRIWDSLPPSFPRYPGAKPTEPTGPASATLVIPSDVQTATSWMKAALDAGEWVTIVGGPLEDGSMALESAGTGDCDANTRIAKVGGVTIMTILYGAACPFQ
jgi:hypothetical protein